MASSGIQSYTVCLDVHKTHKLVPCYPPRSYPRLIEYKVVTLACDKNFKSVI